MTRAQRIYFGLMYTALFGAIGAYAWSWSGWSSSAASLLAAKVLVVVWTAMFYSMMAIWRSPANDVQVGGRLRVLLGAIAFTMLTASSLLAPPLWFGQIAIALVMLYAALIPFDVVRITRSRRSLRPPHREGRA